MALRYITVADFRKRLEAGGGPDPSQDQAIPTHWEDDQLNVFLQDAESELETRVRRRYAVPLPTDPVAPIVMQLVMAFGAYHAMLAMRKSKDFESDQDPYLLRYRWAVDLLDKIGAGAADIPGAEDGFGASAYEQYDGRLFTPGQFGIGTPGAPDRRTDLRRPRR